MLSRFRFINKFNKTIRKYHKNVIEHYENPRNVGSFPKEKKNIGTALVGAPSCGDVMKLQILVDSNIIKDVKFKTFGCGSAIASSSFATEMIKGKTLEEAEKITNKSIAKHLNLPPVKLHCSMLAEDAIRSSIKNFRKIHSTYKSHFSTNSKTKPLIHFSDAALTQIEILKDNNPGKYIILQLKNGGCSGFSYEFSINKSIENAEEIPPLYIDKMSLLYLIGTKVDWTVDSMGQRFTFDNQNAAASCGCGISFTPEEFKNGF